MQSSILRMETLTGPPITIQDARVHVRSQVVQLRIPGINAAVIWNRPVEVALHTLEGQEKVVPIPDVTRTAMLAFAGLWVIGLFIFLIRRKSKS